MIKAKKHAVAAVDCRCSEKIYISLKDYADTVLLLPPSPRLAPPVASHPDMLMWVHGKRIVTYAHYADIARDAFGVLKKLGIEIILCKEEPDATYPRDVYLNCASVGSHLIANKKTVSDTISKMCVERGVSLLNTKQGYAKCSTCVVSENAIITADRSIHSAALSADIRALLISEDGVRLEGYDRGFIGGATGTDNNNVYFCGELDTHPDSAIIKQFVLECGKTPVSLSDEPLYDLGTIMFFDK